MKRTPGASPWQYDEFAHVGVDYSDEAVVRKYDERHARFRDVERDALLILNRLELGPEDTVIDLGCGSGAFTLTAARHVKEVHAVDVSRAMLNLLGTRADQLAIRNITTHHAGFLTHVHRDAPADAAVSVAALHHLPDFWKAVALDRLADMIRPGGKFYLFDVVFSFPSREHRGELDAWVDTLRTRAGDELAEETIVHIRDEHSTFKWIMEGLLTRSGFRIDRTFSDFPQCLAFLCTRV